MNKPILLPSDVSDICLMSGGSVDPDKMAHFKIFYPTLYCLLGHDCPNNVGGGGGGYFFTVSIRYNETLCLITIGLLVLSFE